MFISIEATFVDALRSRIDYHLKDDDFDLIISSVEDCHFKRRMAFIIMNEYSKRNLPVIPNLALYYIKFTTAKYRSDIIKKDFELIETFYSNLNYKQKYLNPLLQEITTLLVFT